LQSSLLILNAKRSSGGKKYERGNNGWLVVFETADFAVLSHIYHLPPEKEKKWGVLGLRV
jgi:hypothetical protein